MNSMRVLPVVAILLVSIRSFAAVDVSDLGVPNGWSAQEYDDYGNDLLNKKKYAESRKYFAAAIRLEPTRWTAFYNRATAFRMEKNWKAAIGDLNETIRLEPAFFRASWDRAATYESMGNYAAALRDLDTLQKMTYQTSNPDEQAWVFNQRASLRATCPDASFRDGKAATADAKKACDLARWGRASYIDTLAAACAEMGDFDSAVRYEHQAIDLNRSGKDDSVKKTGSFEGDKIAVKAAEYAQKELPDYLKRLELYKQHHPYRIARPQ